MPLSNQKRMNQPPLINLNSNEYSQKCCYYPFVVILDRCVSSCNTLNDLSNKVYVPNKREYLNLSMFNMITGMNESKKLTKHRSCKCKINIDIYIYIYIYIYMYIYIYKTFAIILRYK